MCIQLRSIPLTVSGKEARESFQLRKGGWPLEYIQNDFEDRGEIVLDHATGLMWQKSGSDSYMSYVDAQKYIKHLNQQKFAGYDDWRLPTIPELMSLLELEAKNDDFLYINPMFDAKQWRCWSADKRTEEGFGPAWDIDFRYSSVHFLNFYHCFVRAVRS